MVLTNLNFTQNVKWIKKKKLEESSILSGCMSSESCHVYNHGTDLLCVCLLLNSLGRSCRIFSCAGKKTRMTSESVFIHYILINFIAP